MSSGPGSHHLGGHKIPEKPHVMFYLDFNYFMSAFKGELKGSISFTKDRTKERLVIASMHFEKLFFSDRKESLE